MNKMSKKPLYRVRFQDPSERKTVEVVVESVLPSDFMGLVTLEGFVFNDNKKLVIMPEEEAARSRFGKTDRLHIPYHAIIYVEEFEDEPTDLKHLPFMKEVPTDETKPPKKRPSSLEIPTIGGSN